jgi:hypothetical protein
MKPIISDKILRDASMNTIRIVLPMVASGVSITKRMFPQT